MGQINLERGDEWGNIELNTNCQMHRSYSLSILLFLCLPFFVFAQHSHFSSNPHLIKAEALPEQLAGGAVVIPDIISETNQKTHGLTDWLGRSSNIFTCIRNSQNQVAVDPETGFVAFIHQQDVTIWGGGSAATGYLQVDYSTDFGNTWNVMSGPMQSAYALPARYPQIALYRDPVTSSPLDNRMIWAAATTDSTGQWQGHAYGVAQPGAGPGTENYAWGAQPSFIPGSLCKGLLGEYWAVEWMVQNGIVQDTLVLYRGKWDSLSQDVHWGVHSLIPVDADRSWDGDQHFTQPVMAFSPDGSRGWVAVLGDLTESSAPQGQDSMAFAPVLIPTTDGGQTWGTPFELNLNAVPWLRDTLQNGPLDSMGYPIGSGIASAGFELDLVVDGIGNAHIGVLIANGNQDYSINVSGKMFLGHITVHISGSPWQLDYLNPIYTLRGQLGNGTLQVQYDNHIQASRDADGNYILFSYVDTDTTFRGYGYNSNDNPNLYITGRILTTGDVVCRSNWTEKDLLFKDRAYFPTIPAEFVVFPNGDFYLPVIMVDVPITPGYVEDPVQFAHFGPDLPFNTQFSHPHGDYILRNGWVSPNGFCYTIGISEAEKGADNRIFLFPNPASDRVEITSVLGQTTPVDIQLSDLQGRILQKRPLGLFEKGEFRFTLSVSDLPSGMYQVWLTTNSGVEAKPLIIQR